jgi:hypothetical protein
MSAIEHRRTRVPGLIDPAALPPWTPGGISGAVLWLHTGAGLWQDAAKSVPADADTDPIYTWADQSGLGHDFVQATEGNRPLLKTDVSGTVDAVEFDAYKWLEIGSALYGSGNATVFLVVYLSSASERGTIFGVGSGSNGWKIGVGGSTFDSPGDNLVILFDNVKWIGTGDAIGTGLHVIAVRLSSGVPEWWIDGVTAGSTTGTPNAPSALTSIGRDGADSRYYTDHLVEVIASDESLDAEEMAAVHNYLLGKYGL